MCVYSGIHNYICTLISGTLGNFSLRAKILITKQRNGIRNLENFVPRLNDLGVATHKPLLREHLQKGKRKWKRKREYGKAP